MKSIACSLCLGLFLVGAATAHADAPSSTERRLDPVGDLNPAAVSVRLMKKIASGTWQLDRFIEPSRGIVVIHYEDYDSYAHLDRRSRHYCGDDLAALLPKLRKDIAGALALLSHFLVVIEV